MPVETIRAGHIAFQVGDRAEALHPSDSSALELGNRLFGGGRHEGVRFPLPDVEAQRNLQEIVDCATRDVE